MLDPSKIARYANTILEFGGDPPLRIDLRQPLSLAEVGRVQDEAAPRFTVITAENPFGIVQHPQANRAATARLHRLLDESGLQAVPAAGVDPESTHREEGFALAGEAGPAISIAVDLGQDAVFYFDGERFLLVDCADGSRYMLPRSSI